MKARSVSIVLLMIALLSVSCSDKTTKPAPTPYDNASVLTGGIMYDRFWSTEAGFDQGHPNLGTFASKSDFFRCKQCHGWDLLGRNGAYINRGPTTSRPNVASLNLYQYAKTTSPQDIFNGIKRSAGRRDVSYDLSTYNPVTNSTIGDQMPNFSQILTDAQIWDIVKFLKEGAFDVTQLYDANYTGTYPTGSAAFSNVGRDGSSSSGSTRYASTCSPCHGATGTMIPVEGMTAGKFVRTKPNEAQHKIKYGQLGTSMTASATGGAGITLSQMKDLYKAMADTLAFPN